MADNNNNNSNKQSSDKKPSKFNNDPAAFNNDPVRYQYGNRAPAQSTQNITLSSRSGASFRVDPAFAHLYGGFQIGSAPSNPAAPASTTSFVPTPSGQTPSRPIVPARADTDDSDDSDDAEEESEDEPRRPDSPRMQSVDEARAWRRRQVHHMKHPNVPADFEAKAQDHVTEIYNAITSYSNAKDGKRRTTVRGEEQEVRGSKGYRAISGTKYDHEDAEAAAWVVWNRLSSLHREGSTLRAPEDFPRNLGHETSDLGLTIQERLEAVCELLQSFKSCALDAMGPDERKIEIMVRAPVATLRTKRQYQASNDNRKAVYASGKKNLPARKKKTKATKVEEDSDEDPGFEKKKPVKLLRSAHSTAHFWPSIAAPVSGSSTNTPPAQPQGPGSASDDGEDDDGTDSDDGDDEDDEDYDGNAPSPSKRRRK